MKSLTAYLENFPSRTIKGAIVLYQKTLSPDQSGLYFGSAYIGCRFFPSCSEYARRAISQYGLIKGCVLSLKRIFRCHPFNPGGYDPI
ncbi:MAG: membrane protein insertion efficiency factor YidD [Candidatus Sungbacteria bacterium]|nr:membrane protein insertion efficiency factor YidD [Candidatus Sungbacteria bacterium]